MPETAQVASNIQPPIEFNFGKPEVWPAWLKRFDRYISIANLTSKPEKEKIDLFCYVMDEKSKEILNQVLPQINADTTLDTVKQKLTTYFSSKKNQIFKRNLILIYSSLKKLSTRS